MKLIPVLVTLFGLTVIAQAADPTPAASPKAKAKATKHHKTPGKRPPNAGVHKQTGS